MEKVRPDRASDVCPVVALSASIVNNRDPATSLSPVLRQRDFLDQEFTREEFSMAWLILFIAGLFEVGWAIGLKYTSGFTRLGPTVWTLLSMVASVWLLGIALKQLPVGTAYSVWVGVGSVGTVLLGILLFDEPVSFARMLSVLMIIAGIIGLKLATGS